LATRVSVGLFFHGRCNAVGRKKQFVFALALSSIFFSQQQYRHSKNTTFTSAACPVLTLRLLFVASATFAGAKPGCAFQAGTQGTG
jgi:hypothetical protein